VSVLKERQLILKLRLVAELRLSYLCGFRNQPFEQNHSDGAEREIYALTLLKQLNKVFFTNVGQANYTTFQTR